MGRVYGAERDWKRVIYLGGGATIGTTEKWVRGVGQFYPFLVLDHEISRRQRFPAFPRVFGSIY